jgi:hypothetical protein
MTQQSFFTIGQLAEHCHEPEWKIRRVVDSLESEVPRAGQYRLVPCDLLPAINAKLHPAAEQAK